MVRCSQTTSRSRRLSGIRVASTQGIEAERNSTLLTETMAATNLTTTSASFSSMAGRNISARPAEIARATSIGSFRPNSQVTG
ncbi:hypothetical protein D3C85_1598270 [compost metagenome]